MAEWINTATQSVAVGSNVIFNETVEKSCCSVTHRDSSGLFTLHGGNRYLVGFSANITGATAGTELDLSITINGEEIVQGLMTSTPATAGDLNNVSAFTYVTVPRCCCYTVAIENTGSIATTVSNANIIIVKED